eukprot:scaffold2004_cov420-Prasinococcus_capsulatus_cf.AAC.16
MSGSLPTTPSPTASGQVLPSAHFARLVAAYSIPVEYQPTTTSFGFTLWFKSSMVRWNSMSSATCPCDSLWGTAYEFLISISPLSSTVPSRVPITRCCPSFLRT